VTGTHSIERSVVEGLSSERPDDFNLGLGTTKAVYMPHDQAWPHEYVVDREALSDDDATALLEAVPTGAVDLMMAEQTIDVDVGAVIVATGWKPYDPAKLDTLGYGRFANVITNVMMERLASDGGPTGGKIVRPSDGEPAKNVALVQCAGSRDENHLPYCSAVCCMGSLKQVRYIREKNEDARATVFYIDIRTIGRLEKFYQDLVGTEGVTFTKGKVAEIEEDAGTGNLTLKVEDTIAGDNLSETFDLVVLATGVVPNTVGLDIQPDPYGFLDGDLGVPGVFAAGCARHPCDVSRTTKEATAAALKAIQFVSREG
jgi:quinone-modifying oxidoreductase subunit QmoA